MSWWLGRRLIGTLACLALLTGGGRGLCFMQAGRPLTGDTADAHGCCKKGLSNTVPGCCHSESRPDSVATVKKTTSVAFHPPVPSALPQAVASVSIDLVTARAGVSHSPPPTVLRI